MFLLDKIDAWSERHHPKWIDVLRILLGLLLFSKGIYFISHTDTIVFMLQQSNVKLFSIAIAHYVAMAHIAGGILIALGLLTRISVLFQIPILIGAVFFVNLPKGIFSFNSETELSILVLFLLLFFLIEGSGPFSVDNYIRKHPDE
jgi:putative oxidoreductase